MASGQYPAADCEAEAEAGSADNEDEVVEERGALVSVKVGESSDSVAEVKDADKEIGVEEPGDDILCGSQDEINHWTATYVRS